MKIKDDSNNDLHLQKTLQLYNLKAAVIYALHEDNNYHPQVFLDERLY